MPRNIEIKARIPDIKATFIRVAEIADQGPIEISQDDFFFSCPNGRLKLRILSHGKGRLIFYKRQDRHGPKECFYVISETKSPESLLKVLSLAFGQKGHVKKHRTLYISGRTRIHIDRVDGLGDFLELEVVLNEGEDLKTGTAEADELLERLGVSREQLVEGAYVDYLHS